MPNTKRIPISRATGGNLYCIVKRLADSYLLDPADGVFKVAVASPYSVLTEDATIKGSYQLTESRTVWTSGDYLIGIYVRLGGAPAPSTDTVITYPRPVISVRGDQFAFEGFDSDYQASVVNGVINNSNSLMNSRMGTIETDVNTIGITLKKIMSSILDFDLRSTRNSSSNAASRSNPLINKDN